MNYVLIFKRIDRVGDKRRTTKDTLYTGDSYSELIRIQDREVVCGLHSVSASRNGNVLTITIVENNA